MQLTHQSIGEGLDLTPRGTLEIDCLVNGPIQTNTYFVRSGDETVVIDPAWEGGKLLEAYRGKHRDAHITAIICTHGHADHVGGVAGLRRELGDEVPFIISAKDAEIIPVAFESIKRRWDYDFEYPPAPDALLADGDVISFGDAELQVIETPGHTPGGVVLFCATEQGNIAFVGDTLFPGGHGRTDLEGGDQAAVIASLGRMGALLPPETTCLIGHDQPTTIADELKGNLYMQRGLRRRRRHQDRG